jgi:hypothetical protein
VIAVVYGVAAGDGRFERGYPSAAHRAVVTAAADPGVRVFATERFADWLLWYQPSLSGRVAYDIRFELLSREDLRLVSGLSSRFRPVREATLRGYGVVVLDPREDPIAAGGLRRDGWRPLFARREILVLARR